MFTISNPILNVRVSPRGAELQSFFDKRTATEFMWSGDPAFWGKKSPVLFPIVGTLKNNAYTYKGTSYTLGRHGFARDMDFELAGKTADTVLLSLKENEKTLAVYPFKFSLSLEYRLVDNVLAVSYIVENTGDEEMYFSVGGHPAFSVPFDENTTFEDYKLVFEAAETTGRWPLNEAGLIKEEPITLFTNDRELPLKRQLFASDALVFKHLNSTEVSIESSKTSKSLRVGFNGFPYLGIWQAPGANFLCIEPWCGIADSVAATGNLQDKEGIMLLPSSAIFKATFTIQVI